MDINYKLEPCKNEHVTLLYKQAAVCDRRIHLFIQEDLLIGACFIYNSTIPSNHFFLINSECNSSIQFIKNIDDALNIQMYYTRK